MLTEKQFKLIPILGLSILPFHVLEEYIGNYPVFLHTHYHTPRVLSYPHWLVNNLLFFLTLSIGLLVFLKDSKKNLPFGLGIIIWLFINFLEHTINSLLDHKLSPGIITSILFLICVILSILTITYNKMPVQIKKSFIIGVLYWIIPITLILPLGILLLKFYPKYF